MPRVQLRNCQERESDQVFKGFPTNFRGTHVQIILLTLASSWAYCEREHCTVSWEFLSVIALRIWWFSHWLGRWSAIGRSGAALFFCRFLKWIATKDGGRSGARVDPLTRQVPTFWSTGRITSHFSNKDDLVSFIKSDGSPLVKLIMLAVITFTIWMIWRMRNYVRFQDKIDFSRAISIIKDLIFLLGNSSKVLMKNDRLNFNIINFLGINTRTGKVFRPLPVRWQFPSPGWVIKLTTIRLLRDILSCYMWRHFPWECEGWPSQQGDDQGLKLPFTLWEVISTFKWRPHQGSNRPHQKEKWAKTRTSNVLPSGLIKNKTSYK